MAVPAGNGVSVTGSGRGPAADPFSSNVGTARARGNNPVTGVATARQPFSGTGGGDFVSFPFYGPWGQWYPWYSSGFGWYAGYYGYNPWNYGATCWGWGMWGPWYDPYSYCYGSYYYPPAYVGLEFGGGGGGAANPHQGTGDVRLLASPKTARVYIDDALVGTVDEFNGLNSHLEIDGGRHLLGLRAEGYESYSQEIVVESGRTQTVRITMKKAK